MVTSGDFESLIRRAQKGESDALEELVRSCRDYLLLIANQELSDNLQAKLGASDIVQSVFAKAHQKLCQFEGESQESLLAWLKAILRNEIASANRRYTATKRDMRREVANERQSKADVLDLLRSESNSPSDRMIADEETLLLRQSLAELPDEYRQVVLLRNWDHLSFEAIGKRTGRSAEAARKLWVRGLKCLQKIMCQKNGNEDD